MKKIIWVAIVFILIVGGYLYYKNIKIDDLYPSLIDPQEQNPAGDTQVKEKNEAINCEEWNYSENDSKCYFEINPVGKIVLEIVTTDDLVSHVNIFDSLGNLLQTLFDVTEVNLAYVPGTLIKVEDINFDGYQDLKFLRWSGATGNVGFTYFIYDKDKMGFYNSIPELNELGYPVLNSETKTISTYSKGGDTGLIYYSATYKIESNKLVLIEDESQDFLHSDNSLYDDDGVYILTKRKLINGEMVITEKLTRTRDEIIQNY